MKTNDDWEKIRKPLSNLPVPSPRESFVHGVMSQIRKIRNEERERISWRDFWKIPALGFGFAAVLLAIMTAVWKPDGSIESYLIANFQDPMVSKWVSETDMSKRPAPDEVLQFALEDSGEDSGGNL